MGERKPRGWYVSEDILNPSYASSSSHSQAPIIHVVESKHWHELESENTALAAKCDDVHGEFKNFHRLVCESVNYYHDEIDWKRDQASLINCIDKLKSERDLAVEALEKAEQYLRQSMNQWRHYKGESSISNLDDDSVESSLFREIESFLTRSANENV